MLHLADLSVGDDIRTHLEQFKIISHSVKYIAVERTDSLLTRDVLSAFNDQTYAKKFNIATQMRCTSVMRNSSNAKSTLESSLAETMS